jgi:hypothetical protein
MAIYSGFSHEKLWFSIAMLVYPGVSILEVTRSIVPGGPRNLRHKSIFTWNPLGWQRWWVSPLATPKCDLSLRQEKSVNGMVSDFRSSKRQVYDSLRGVPHCNPYLHRDNSGNLDSWFLYLLFVWSQYPFNSDVTHTYTHHTFRYGRSKLRSPEAFFYW